VIRLYGILGKFAIKQWTVHLMLFKTLFTLCSLFILSACGSSDSSSSSGSSNSTTTYSYDEGLAAFKTDINATLPTGVRYVTDECTYDSEGYGDSYLVSCLVQRSELNDKWGIATLSSLVETNTLNFSAYSTSTASDQTITSIGNSYQDEFVKGYYESNSYVCDTTNCVLTASNFDKTTCVISTQACSFSEYTLDSLDSFLSVYGRTLRDRYLMVDNLPALPSLSANYGDSDHADYISGESGVYSVIAKDTGWEGTADWKKSLIRTPLCLETGGSTGTCYAFVTDTEIQECKWAYPDGEQSCTVYSEIPESLKSLIRDQHDFHGFNYARTQGYTYDKSVIIVDDAFEPTHGLHGDKFTNVTMLKTDGSYFGVDLDDSLARYQGSDWSNTSQHHGSSTSSVLAFEGPSIEAWSIGLGWANDILNHIPLDSSSIVSYAWGVEAVALPASGNFLITAGNVQENWSDPAEANEYGFYTANLTELDRLIIFGSVDINKATTSVTGFPGSIAAIQNRWLVALGEDVLVASSIGGTKNYITEEDGNSFAEPSGSKALALLASTSVCLGSTIPNLMQVLLDTADKTFTGYDVAVHGMGLLDVEAALKYIETNSCP